MGVLCCELGFLIRSKAMWNIMTVAGGGGGGGRGRQGKQIIPRIRVNSSEDKSLFSLSQRGPVQSPCHEVASWS